MSIISVKIQRINILRFIKAQTYIDTNLFLFSNREGCAINTELNVVSIDFRNLYIGNIDIAVPGEKSRVIGRSSVLNRTMRSNRTKLTIIVDIIITFIADDLKFNYVSLIHAVRNIPITFRTFISIPICG